MYIPPLWLKTRHSVSGILSQKQTYINVDIEESANFLLRLFYDFPRSQHSSQAVIFPTYSSCGRLIGNLTPLVSSSDPHDVAQLGDNLLALARSVFRFLLANPFLHNRNRQIHHFSAMCNIFNKIVQLLGSRRRQSLERKGEAWKRSSHSVGEN